MIKYDPMRKTMKEKGISTYKLIHKYKISASTVDRIRRNKPLTTTTVNDLCTILGCRIEDIMEYVPDTDDNQLPDRKSVV